MTEILSALVQAWVYFKIRTHCLSAAKAKRHRQLRLGEIIKIILGDERNEALHENRRYGENKSYRWTR